MAETLSHSTFIDYTVSRFHAAHVIVALFAREARESCSRANPVQTPVVFSARHTIIASQSVVVCPGLLVGTVTILSDREIFHVTLVSYHSSLSTCALSICQNCTIPAVVQTKRLSRNLNTGFVIACERRRIPAREPKKPAAQVCKDSRNPEKS